MSKGCLKCGYERQASDDFPEWGCPKCGAVYAKVEARSGTADKSDPPRHPKKKAQSQIPTQTTPQRDWKKQPFSEVSKQSTSRGAVREDVKQTKNCPFCGEEILAVAIKCKHCGSMLERPAPVGRSTERKDSKKTLFSEDLSRKETALIIVLVSVFIVAYGLLRETDLLDKPWAHLVAPFDPRPEFSFLEMIQNPEETDKKKEELCAWSKREELRNPSPLMSAARESACQ